MTSDQDSDALTQADARRAQAQAMVLNAIRIAGAAFLLAGTAIAVDLAGFASLLNLAQVKYIVGGALIAVGLMDFFVLPVILTKAFAARRKN